jgi:hypothetical protein
MNKERFNELLKKEKFDNICIEVENIMSSPLYNRKFAYRSLMIFFPMLRSLILLRDTKGLILDYDLFFEYFELKNMKKFTKNKYISKPCRDGITKYIKSLTDGSYHEDDYIYFDGNFHEDVLTQLKLQIN